MTFPITPLKSIHNDITDIKAAEAQLAETLQIMQQILSTFADQIIQGLVNAFFRALGLGAYTGPIDQILTDFETQVVNFVAHPLGTVITDLQNLIDDICNALGISGVGHSIGDVLTALEHIPGDVIDGITTIEQEILDTIANALGHAGTGHTLSQVEGYLENIPASVVSSIFGGTSLGGDVQGIVDKVIHTFNPLVGTGNPLTGIESAIQKSLGGLLPGAVSNGDGTSTALSGITSNGDGTSTLTSNPIGSIFSMIEGGDGTVMSPAEALQNAAQFFGRLPYALSSVQSVSDQIGLAATGVVGTHPISSIEANLSGVLGSLLTNTIWNTFLSEANTALATAGSDLAHLIAGLGSIPFANLSAVLGSANLGADVQAVVDNLANAFGHAGTGHTLANLLSYAEAIPNTAITDILGGSNLGADVQSIVTEVTSALGGATTTLSGLVSQLGAIPNGNVLGEVGATIGADVTGLVSVLGSFFGSIFGVSAPTTYAAMNNYVGPTALQLDAASTLSNAAAVALAAQAISNPSSWGIDPTADPVFNLHSLTGSSATTVPVTSSTSAIGFIGTPNATTKKSIAFLGYFTGSLTTITLNLYSVDVTSGALTFLFSSGDMISGPPNLTTGSTPEWVYYNFTSPQIFSTPTISSLADNQAVQTDWYAVEMQVTGGGTYNLVGIPGHWLPANTSSSFPQQLGAKRTGSPVGSAANIAAPGPTGSSNIPWFALCGAAGISEQAPQTQSFLMAGSDTYTPPVWAQQTVDAGGTIFFDLVAVGGGGSGQYPASPNFGYGGAAGAWNTSRLTYNPGDTIPATMGVTVGAGGAGVGTTVSVGNAGGNSSISGTGITTLTALGGAGGNNPYTAGSEYGSSPGNSSGPTGSPLGLTYTGGTGGTLLPLSPPGGAPGGSGTGGQNYPPGSGNFNFAPGAGAAGAVFVTCYQ